MFRKSNRYTWVGRVIKGQFYVAVDPLPDGDVYTARNIPHTRLLVALALMMALWVGSLSGWLVRGMIIQKDSHAQKVAFCHDRMQSQEVRWVWRQEYCKAEVKLDAVDPINGRPVAGLVKEN